MNIIDVTPKYSAGGGIDIISEGTGMYSVNNRLERVDPTNNRAFGIRFSTVSNGVDNWNNMNTILSSWINDNEVGVLYEKGTNTGAMNSNFMFNSYLEGASGMILLNNSGSDFSYFGQNIFDGGGTNEEMIRISSGSSGNYFSPVFLQSVRYRDEGENNVFNVYDGKNNMVTAEDEYRFNMTKLVIGDTTNISTLYISSKNGVTNGSQLFFTESSNLDAPNGFRFMPQHIRELFGDWRNGKWC